MLFMRESSSFGFVLFHFSSTYSSWLLSSSGNSHTFELILAVHLIWFMYVNWSYWFVWEYNSTVCELWIVKGLCFSSDWAKQLFQQKTFVYLHKYQEHLHICCVKSHMAWFNEFELSLRVDFLMKLLTVNFPCLPNLLHVCVNVI